MPHCRRTAKPTPTSSTSTMQGISALKTANAGGASVHTVYLFDTLELRRAAFSSGDYVLDDQTEVPNLIAKGARLARVVLEGPSDGEPRLDGTSRQHVFFELGERLGSQ